jgi:hypothetical protein
MVIKQRADRSDGKACGRQIEATQLVQYTECAFSFLALGKIARSANKSTVNAEMKVNGKQ